jgi:Domain of unknown function (DUF5615)
VERFSILTDENTAKGIAKALIDRGWDVVRGVCTLVQGTHDDVLLLKAVELNRVLLTRDVDLEVIAHRWLREWRPFPGVIFWRQEPRQEKSTLGEVVEAIEALAEQEDPFAYPIVYLRPRKK